ncbi:hypothetical protein AAEX28_05600 [Lentisphaerota bacterium WC36G]|nr:hypothetical protein LJT99_08460 [Lentisphaerae bacterium WC36]
MNTQADEIEKIINNWQTTSSQLLTAINNKKIAKYEELYRQGNQQFAMLKLVIESGKINKLKPHENTITEVLKDWRQISYLLEKWSKDVFADIKKIQKKQKVHKNFNYSKSKSGSIFSITN